MKRQVRSYVSFFIRQKKLLEFFGSDILALSAAILLVCLFMIFMHPNISGMDTFVLMFLGAFIVLASAFTLPWVLSSQLSSSQRDYLYYLGFNRKHIRMLTHLIALPITASTSFCFFILTTSRFPWWQALLLTVIALVVGGVFGAVALQLQDWWERKAQTVQATSSPNTVTARCLSTLSGTSTVHHSQTASDTTAAFEINNPTHSATTLQPSIVFHAFSNPYRAFFRKDIRELQNFDVHASSALLMLLGIGAILLAGIAPYWQVFFVCLYLVLAFATILLAFWLYACEQKAYSYYRCILRLTNSSLVAFKLPLQLFVILGVSCASTLLHALVARFTVEFLLVSTVVTTHTILVGIAYGWWFMYRLQKGREFHMIYLLGSLVVAVPGFAVIYLLTVVLPRYRTALRQVERTNLA